MIDKQIHMIDQQKKYIYRIWNIELASGQKLNLNFEKKNAFGYGDGEGTENGRTIYLLATIIHNRIKRMLLILIKIEKKKTRKENLRIL